jgi:outer membrane immunogenic protein
MKRIAIALLAGVAAVAGLGYSASAADMAVKALPPAPVLPSWTGFYIGVHAGAAWESSPNWGYFDPNAAAGLNVLTPNVGVNTGSPNMGAVGGIQGGYNWQFASAWVAGIEGDISWTALADHRTTGDPILATGVPFPGINIAMSANTQWLSSVRGRLGFVGWWNTMFYATGGVAWANIEYTGTNTFTTGPVLTSLSNTSFNTTKTGWVIGGGAEWQATTNILLRAEYLYYNIDNGNVSASAPFSPPVAGLGLAPTYNFSSYNIQVFRVAGSYKF